jgi:thiol-disulfide isomerase/thioredoxin
MNRKLTIISLLILITTISFGQNQHKTIISGQLPDFKSKNITLVIGGKKQITKVDSKGYFRYVVQCTTPRFAYLTEPNQKIFLLPNDSLFINGSDKLLYKGGQSAIINNYYLDWNKYQNTVSDTVDEKAYYSQEPTRYITSVNNWIEIWEQPLHKLQKTNPDLNKDFISLEKSRIKYLMYSDLNDYAKNYSAHTGKLPYMPNTFYDYLNTVNLNDTTLFQFDEYKYFLTSYIYMQYARQDKIADGLSETTLMLDLINNSLVIQIIKDEVLKEIMRVQTSSLNVNDSIIIRFENSCSNKDYVSAIKGNYDNLKPLLKGNKALDFELIGLNGEKKSLKDFAGKYLLIDVWSTTCAPCLREAPILEKIKHELQGNNIKIVAACLSDETTWKSKLSKQGLKDGQYRIENGWKSQFRMDYLKDSGVPVYIIIDPQGFIVSARAPKPSEGLMDTIKQLKNIE